MEKTVHLYISIILVLFVDINCGVEEAAPEVFLPPRNFNPHPYEIGYDPSAAHRRRPLPSRAVYENQLDPYSDTNTNDNNIGNTGPVLFPSNTPENANTFVPVPVRDDHPINRHPYAVVAKKKKYSLGLGHFKEEQVNPQVYRGLAAHAQRVLQVPQAKDLKNVKIDPSFTNQKKDYAFSYKVVDHLTGDDFSHTQSQNSHATNGEYRVKLPDGRVQIVSYTADKNGYKADVKYDDETPKYQQVPHNNHINQQIITPNPHNQHNHVNYEYYIQQQPLVYNTGNLQQHYQKTLIYPENIQVLKFAGTAGDIHEEEKVGKFIGSTLAPYTVDGSKGPALAPNLDKFNPVYIDAVQLHQSHYKK